MSTARGEGTAQSRETAAPAPATQPGASDTALATMAQEVANFQSPELQAAVLKMVRHVVANTEDVGHSFAEEARKIHYGETEQRNIRGHATAEETAELMEEGIGVMPLPLPDLLKEPLQ